jgi:hypothetical protein
MAERPGWHGIPPSADRFIASVEIPPPAEKITEPAKAWPIWVNLTYESDSAGAGLRDAQTVKGFAMAWTSDAVLAQWVEYSRAREAWVPVAVCSRRMIGDQRPGGTVTRTPAAS